MLDAIPTLKFNQEAINQDTQLFHYLEATSPFSGDKLKNKGMENLMSKSEKEKLLHSKNFELNKGFRSSSTPVASYFTLKVSSFNICWKRKKEENYYLIKGLDQESEIPSPKEYDLT
nr:uncharacterized protein LOC112800989 isoform X2 [Arachis hypogaea]